MFDRVDRHFGPTHGLVSDGTTLWGIWLSCGRGLSGRGKRESGRSRVIVFWWSEKRGIKRKVMTEENAKIWSHNGAIYFHPGLGIKNVNNHVVYEHCITLRMGEG